MTKTIAAQGLKLQLQKLQNKNSVLEDRNERLELSANQVPGLKANIKTIIKKNRQNELDIFDFKTNLEETTANLKKTKQELNISIYLSNEERVKPQLLDMFCKISKSD